MVLDKLPVLGRPTIWMIVGQGPIALAVGAGGGVVWTFLVASILSLERRRGRVVRAARLWCRKSPYRVSSRLGCALGRLENSLCQPSRKWVPFSN